MPNWVDLSEQEKERIRREAALRRMRASDISSTVEGPSGWHPSLESGVPSSTPITGLSSIMAFKPQFTGIGAVSPEQVATGQYTSQGVEPTTTIPPSVDPSAVTPAVDPSVIPTPTPTPTPEISPIGLGGGLSGAAQGRLQAIRDKWGGRMDAHAFATGATSRRKSFESGLGSVFAAPKDPLTKEMKIGDKIWTLQWDRASQKWVPLTSAPRWQDKDPVTEKDVQDRRRYVTGPNKGELVFPNVQADPKMEKGPNNRWRYMGGDKHGQLVFPGETGKGIPKEYEPTTATKELNEYWRQKELATGQPVPASEKVQDIERWNLDKKAKETAVPTYDAPKNYLVNGQQVLGYVKKEPGEAPVLVGMDGNKLEGAVIAPTAAQPQAWRQQFNLQRDLENEIRVKAGRPLLTTEEEQTMLEQWHLTQRVDEAPTPAVLAEWDSVTTSFQTSEDIVQRMLTQLMDPKVVVGTVGGLVQWWESITDQVRQASNLVLTTSRNNPLSEGAERVRDDGTRYAVDEGVLLNSRIYEFGSAEKSSQYASNVTQLAYTLARNLDPSGRLSDFDVQQQINRITAGGQSKSRQAANLVEVFNGLYDSFHNRYSAAYRRGTITDNISSFAKGKLAIEEIQDGLWGVGYLGQNPETGAYGINAFRTWRTGE